MRLSFKAAFSRAFPSSTQCGQSNNPGPNSFHHFDAVDLYNFDHYRILFCIYTILFTRDDDVLNVENDEMYEKGRQVYGYLSKMTSIYLTFD